MNRVSGKRAAALQVGIGLLVLLMAGLPAMTKVEFDFNPNLDFSQFKTYAYIGGVEHLALKIHDFRNTEGLAMVQIRYRGGFETKNEAFT